MIIMGSDKILIIGGGLAGLSAGCYARMNGWQTHIFEHSAQPGGLCAAWTRDPYVIDGCIQWLMGAGEGGTFRPIYEELGVIRDVPLRVVRLLERYEDSDAGIAIDLSDDMDRLRAELRALAPDDERELDRLFDSVHAITEVPLAVDRPPELMGVTHRMRQLWDMRHFAGTALHFRGSVGEWRDKHLASPRLRKLFGLIVHPDMPVMFLPVFLSQLARGQLQRPHGGSARFRDAVVRRYRELGGELSLESTVEEILVENERAVGVRLADGSIVHGDLVVSTASTPETAYRLLGGRFLDRATVERMETWPMFDPIALISLGVERDLGGEPPALLLEQSKPLAFDNRAHDTLYVRVYNDDPSFAPPGHTVLQTIIGCDYHWWATRRDQYYAEKDAAIQAAIERLDQRFPGIRDAVRMTDMATPLTFWRYARSWHGAYEGWLPTPRTYRTHLSKEWPGVENLFLAGQWVEPGGGVPTALMSGRQLVQILCDRAGKEFQRSMPPGGEAYQPAAA